MKDSRWYFGAALLFVLVVGAIFFVVQSNTHSAPDETPSTTVDASSSQTLYTQGTSSAVINPNAIPE